MFAPSSLDRQLAATWTAARTDWRGPRRRSGVRLVRAGR
jgi:hypothetical protein